MYQLLALAAEAGEESDPPNPVIPEVNEIVWAALFFFRLGERDATDLVCGKLPFASANLQIQYSSLVNFVVWCN